MGFVAKRRRGGGGREVEKEWGRTREKLKLDLVQFDSPERLQIVDQLVSKDQNLQNRPREPTGNQEREKDTIFREKTRRQVENGAPFRLNKVN